MSTIKERLEEGAAMLDRLDQRRRETRSPRWGYDTEYLIVSRELQQIEHDILHGPCDPTPNLIPARRSGGTRPQL
jgi:hypothetical protein